MTTLNERIAPVKTVAPDPDEPGWLPLGVLLAGIFLIVLDFFIVNVALPSMQRDLHASDTGIEWVVAGFGLTYGGLLLAASRLGDRWGRRRMYGAGIGLFVLASAACGLAQSPEVLVTGRLAQGVAGAMATPMVLALINNVYTGARRVRAIGAYSLAMGVAAAAGQLVGGLLIHLDLFGLGWRTIFLVNVPVGIGILAMLGRLPVARSADAATPDAIELLTATTMLVALTLPLLEGRQQGWPAWTFVSMALALLLAELLVLRGRALLRRGQEPLIGVVLRGDRVLGMGLVRYFVLFLGMASYFFVLAIYLQGGRGLGALTSGALFMFVAIPYLVGTGQAARLAQRWPRWAGPVSAGVFLIGHVLTLDALLAKGSESVLWLAPGLCVAGLGMGLCLTNQIQSLMSSVPPQDAGAVSGVMSSSQQLGNTLGVALIGMIYFGAPHVTGSRVAFERGLVYLIAMMALLAVLSFRRRTTK